MKRIVDLATRTKLLLGFGFMFVLLAVVLVAAYLGISKVRATAQTIQQIQLVDVAYLRDIRANENGTRSDVLEMMLRTDPRALAALAEDIKSREATSGREMSSLMGRAAPDSEFRTKLAAFEQVRTASQQTRDEQVVPLVMAGRLEQAKSLVLGIQSERDAQMRSMADALVNDVTAVAASSVEQSSRLATAVLVLLMIVGGIALVAAVMLALLLDRNTAAPLKSIALLAEQVAAGHLNVELPSRSRGDEVGTLEAAFRKMVAGLREVNSQIRDGINVLGSSASGILAATTQVATGATETATAVTQTTTTVEEVRQTAQMASQKAKQVSESAQKSAQVAQAGKRSVEETVGGMNRIREQMDSIAESIVRLSEQSQAIGEIISTVADLAEQSNLLAVNAAIEAARAGEQGKGFGVVAQEVKSLAGQSKQATTQVRAILGEIQNATNAAVLAAEQGSKAVEAGMRQSAEAGEAIRLLADAILEAAQAATQIAASSQQEFAGMDQVAQAMESVKAASTQNVASTRQAEAAARDLHELGQRLGQVVERIAI